MSDSESRKKQLKDGQLVIRIHKADRDAFVDLCDALDTSAAREIRRFIHEFTTAYETPVDAPEAAAPREKKAKKKKARRTGKA